MFLRSRNSYSASAASRNSSASSASPIKTLYVINHLRDVERMLTLMSPVMATLKLTISSLEITLYITVSFPDFLSTTPNLMTNNCKSCSTYKQLAVESTNINLSFDFRFLLDPFSALALFCQSYQDHE